MIEENMKEDKELMFKTNKHNIEYVYTEEDRINNLLYFRATFKEMLESNDKNHESYELYTGLYMSILKADITCLISRYCNNVDIRKKLIAMVFQELWSKPKIDDDKNE